MIAINEKSDENEEPDTSWGDFVFCGGISQNKLSLDIHVLEFRINAIVRGKWANAADAVLRLGRYFKMKSNLWLNLQRICGLGVTKTGILGLFISVVSPTDN